MLQGIIVSIGLALVAGGFIWFYGHSKFKLTHTKFNSSTEATITLRACDVWLPVELPFLLADPGKPINVVKNKNNCVVTSRIDKSLGLGVTNHNLELLATGEGCACENTTASMDFTSINPKNSYDVNGYESYWDKPSNITLGHIQLWSGVLIILIGIALLLWAKRKPNPLGVRAKATQYQKGVKSGTT